MWSAAPLCLLLFFVSGCGEPILLQPAPLPDVSPVSMSLPQGWAVDSSELPHRLTATAPGKDVPTLVLMVVPDQGDPNRVPARIPPPIDGERETFETKHLIWSVIHDPESDEGFQADARTNDALLILDAVGRWSKQDVEAILASVRPKPRVPENAAP